MRHAGLLIAVGAARLFSHAAGECDDSIRRRRRRRIFPCFDFLLSASASAFSLVSSADKKSPNSGSHKSIDGG
jgi:hypothetical protein